MKEKENSLKVPKDGDATKNYKETLFQTHQTSRNFIELTQYFLGRKEGKRLKASRYEALYIQ